MRHGTPHPVQRVSCVREVPTQTLAVVSIFLDASISHLDVQAQAQSAGISPQQPGRPNANLLPRTRDGPAPRSPRRARPARVGAGSRGSPADGAPPVLQARHVLLHPDGRPQWGSICCIKIDSCTRPPATWDIVRTRDGKGRRRAGVVLRSTTPYLQDLQTPGYLARSDARDQGTAVFYHISAHPLWGLLGISR